MELVQSMYQRYLDCGPPASKELSKRPTPTKILLSLCML